MTDTEDKVQQRTRLSIVRGFGGGIKQKPKEEETKKIIHIKRIQYQNSEQSFKKKDCAVVSYMYHRNIWKVCMHSLIRDSKFK